jgi:hypothetical protein
MMWSEAIIAHSLVHFLFRRAVCCVPNCTWTGHEADLLVVTRNLLAIDMEIKVSRADLKADAFKGKWEHTTGWGANRVTVRRDWPLRTWKHYYVMPRDVWRTELLPALGSSKSGVIVVERRGGNVYDHEVVRRASGNLDAKRLTPEQVVDVARLASLRYWEISARRHADAIHAESVENA